MASILPPPAPKPPLPLGGLKTLLAQLRHAHRAFVLTRVSWLCAAAALALPLLSLGWVLVMQDPIGASYGLWAGLWAAVAALGCRIWAAVWTALAPRPIARPHHVRQAAHWLSKLAPTLGSSVAAALALGEGTVAPGSLEEAHIRATHRAAQAAAPQARLAQSLAARLRPWRRACLRLAVVALLACALGRQSAQSLWDAACGRTPVQLHDAPLWADVQVRVVPPAYSHWPTLDWAPLGLQGRALQGSTVQLRGRADSALKRGLWRMTPGPNETPTPWQAWQPDGQGLWHLQAPVQQSLTIEVAFVGPRGVALQDPGPRTILAVADAPPAIAIDAPLQDVELKDQERLTLRWHATDDIALKDVRLRIHPGRGLPPTLLPQTADTPVPNPAPQDGRLGQGMRRQGEIELSARALGLKDGVEVCLDMEAIDTAPGGQVSHSAPLRVRLFSALAHHEALLGQQEQVQNGLVDWLAQEYAMRAGPTPRRPQSALVALAAQVQSVHGAVQQLAQALADDPLSDDGERLAMGHILGHVARANQQLQSASQMLAPQPFEAQAAAFKPPRSVHGKRRAALEQDILYLDALLAQGRLDVLQEHVKELLAAKAELQDLLAKYRASQDDAVKAELKARMAALREQVQNLLDQMAALRPGLPEGFANAEAQAQDPWGKTMERLDAAMQNDDIDALAQDLEHLANMVDNAAQEAADQMGQDTDAQSAGLKQQLQKMAQDIGALTQGQKELQQAAQKLTQKSLEHAAGGSRAQLAAKLERLRALLNTAYAHAAQALPLLDPHLGVDLSFKEGMAGLEDTLALLQQHALAKASERLAQSTGLMLPARRLPFGGSAYGSLKRAHNQEIPRALQEHLQASFGAQHEAQDALDALLHAAAGPLPQALQPEAQALRKAQQQLAQQAEQAQADAAEAQADNPVMGDEVGQRLSEAGAAMQRAARAFEQGQLGPAAQQQRQARQTLEALGEALQGSQQPGQSGPPKPTGSRRGRGQQGGGSPRRGGQQGGAQGANTESEVAIPPAAETQPDPIRRKLLDHAKEPPPLHYEEAVRKYYETLIR